MSTTRNSKQGELHVAPSHYTPGFNPPPGHYVPGFNPPPKPSPGHYVPGFNPPPKPSPGHYTPGFNPPPKPSPGLGHFSYQCTKASGDYEYTCRMVNLPANARAGRYSTEAECKQACQSLSFKRSFSCEGGRCVLQHVAPDESKGYYATMARCQAYCQKHPSGILSYDCVNGKCVTRHHAGGQFKTKRKCQQHCKTATLFSYQCTKSSGDYEYTCRMVNLPANTRAGRFQTMAECKQACQSLSLKTGYICQLGARPGHSRCQKVAGIPTHDGSNGIYSTEAQCENSTRCGALPTQAVGWECQFGAKPGFSKCVKVNKIPMGRANGVYTTEAECEKNSACGAMPVNLMNEPNWAVGSVEGNPLTHVMSNVGNTGDYIQNFMGSQQHTTYYHNN